MTIEVSVFANFRSDKALSRWKVDISPSLVFPYETVVNALRALYPSFPDLVVNFSVS